MQHNIEDFFNCTLCQWHKNPTNSENAMTNLMVSSENLFCTAPEIPTICSTVPADRPLLGPMRHINTTDNKSHCNKQHTLIYNTTTQWFTTSVHWQSSIVTFYYI